MTNQRPADLAGEVERYLAAIEAFRAEGHEPHWRPEPGALRRHRAAMTPLDRLLFDSARAEGP